MHERARFGVGRPHRESVAYVLLVWRRADQTLRQPCLAAERLAYERAITSVLVRLRAADTFADLMACYALDRLAVHAATGLGGAPPGQERLLPALIEGAAFWRRLRELVAESVD
jgi:hypothetical protein